MRNTEGKTDRSLFMWMCLLDLAVRVSLRVIGRSFLLYEVPLIPAPVDRTSASAWSYKHSWITCRKKAKHRVAFEPKLRSVLRSYMHPCPGNWVEFGRAVVYYARSDQAFSAGIKCRHCTWAPRAEYTTARPIATQFPGHWCTDDLTTENSFHSQATWIIDMLVLFIWHVSNWCFYNRALADVRSTGEGIKCLYCSIHFKIYAVLQCMHSKYLIQNVQKLKIKSLQTQNSASDMTLWEIKLWSWWDTQNNPRSALLSPF